MLFSDEEIKIAEELASQMIDGFNHAYCPNLSDYAFFYYNGKIVLDPWMKESKQNLPWPDHEDKSVAVDPVKHYGEDAIESYLVRLFLLRPELYPDITEKIRKHTDENGFMVKTSSTMPVEVYMAISDYQAEEEHRRVCIGEELPDSKRIYFDMLKLPEELVRVVSNGWQREITFHKDDAVKVMELLYPDGCKFDYKKLVKRCQDRVVRLIGFGD